MAGHERDTWFRSLELTMLGLVSGGMLIVVGLVLDELAFVAERLDDPLVSSMAQTTQDYVATGTRRSGWAGVVTFEGDQRLPSSEKIWRR